MHGFKSIQLKGRRKKKFIASEGAEEKIIIIPHQ